MQMKFITLQLLAIVLMLVACQSKQPAKQNQYSVIDIITPIGETKTEYYTFCGIVPIKSSFTYKVGVWQFYKNDTTKIAEGIYDATSVTIDTAGGCPYTIIENSIDLHKWTFWDDSGNVVAATTALIDIIAFNER